VPRLPIPRIVVTVAVFLAALGLWQPKNTEAGTSTPNTVRVLMLEEPGCHYCAAWDRDVGASYSSTSEGQFAPLIRVRRGAPELAKLSKPATYTPTFIVISGDAEAGRITGYPGAFYFWEELKEILAKTGFKPADVQEGRVQP
jgi:hypothetical protein